MGRLPSDLSVCMRCSIRSICGSFLHESKKEASPRRTVNWSSCSGRRSYASIMAGKVHNSLTGTFHFISILCTITRRRPLSHNSKSISASCNSLTKQKSKTKGGLGKFFLQAESLLICQGTAPRPLRFLAKLPRSPTLVYDLEISNVT